MRFRSTQFVLEGPSHTTRLVRSLHYNVWSLEVEFTFEMQATNAFIDHLLELLVSEVNDKPILIELAPVVVVHYIIYCLAAHLFRQDHLSQVSGLNAREFNFYLRALEVQFHAINIIYFGLLNLFFIFYWQVVVLDEELTDLLDCVCRLIFYILLLLTLILTIL